MLSVKQGGIKYHFLSLWYYSTWDWTQVSRAIGEHSNKIAIWARVKMVAEDIRFIIPRNSYVGILKDTCNSG